MKKLLIIALALLAVASFGAETVKIQGQGPAQISLVKWNTGANTGKTRIRFYTGNTYLDTSTTGQAGAWKRIDNTADSCSQPFLVATDSNGSGRPIWEYRLWQTVKSVHATLGLHVYRIQTREKVYDGSIKATRWTPWTYFGQNTGYVDVTVQDSILMAAPRSASKSSQYSLGFIVGTQARLCPSEAPTTSTATGDSVIADSLFFTAR
jgi:hypothetical protein